MRQFESRDNQLVIGGVTAGEIVEDFGTPVYVSDEEAIRGNFRAIHDAFNKRMPTRIHYACKANANLAILRILEKEGSYIDAVSIGEVEACQRAGYSSSRILYTGVNVSNKELEAVVRRQVPLNIDSFSELDRLGRISKDIPISFRVNPEVGAGHHQHVVTGAKSTKFGIPKGRIIDAYSHALDAGFKPVGIHAHIGAGVQEPGPFVRVTQVLAFIAQQLESKLGLRLEFLDIGGGIGIPYRPEDHPMDLEKLAEEVTSVVKETSIKTMALEPGRYIIADTTLLLTSVNDIKDTPDKRFIGVDAGFNTLLRPSFYGSYHHAVVANKFLSPPELTYDIVGPICESGDFLAKDRTLPFVEEGDIIALYDAGAYGFSMSNQYNMRPKCAEVLVHQGSMNLIREPESIDDLLKHQRIPTRLMV